MCEYPALVLLIRKKESELSEGEQKAIRERFQGLTVRFEHGDPKTENDFNNLCTQFKPDVVFFFTEPLEKGHIMSAFGAQILPPLGLKLLRMGNAPLRYLMLCDGDKLYDGKNFWRRKKDEEGKV